MFYLASTARVHNVIGGGKHKKMDRALEKMSGTVPNVNAALPSHYANTVIYDSDVANLISAGCSSDELTYNKKKGELLNWLGYIKRVNSFSLF